MYANYAVDGQKRLTESTVDTVRTLTIADEGTSKLRHQQTNGACYGKLAFRQFRKAVEFSAQQLPCFAATHAFPVRSAGGEPTIWLF